MQNTESLLQDDTERPSAIVCIAYRQMSTMTGLKDPTEQPKKVEVVSQENKQSDAIVKANFADFKIQSMQTILEFSKDMAESFRLFLEELTVRIEQFREQNQSVLDSFSLTKWTQRDQ